MFDFDVLMISRYFLMFIFVKLFKWFFFFVVIKNHKGIIKKTFKKT